MSSTSFTFDLPRGGTGELVLMPTHSRYSPTTDNSSPSTFFSPNGFLTDSPLVADIFIHHPQCVLPRADTHSHSYLARGTSICKVLKNQGDYMEIGCTTHASCTPRVPPSPSTGSLPCRISHETKKRNLRARTMVKTCLILALHVIYRKPLDISCTTHRSCKKTTPSDSYYSSLIRMYLP
jgi:hypothetical protein